MVLFIRLLNGFKKSGVVQMRECLWGIVFSGERGVCFGGKSRKGDLQCWLLG